MSKGIGNFVSIILCFIILIGVSFIVRGCQDADEKKQYNKTVQAFNQEKLNNSLINTDQFLSELAQLYKFENSFVHKDGYDTVDLKDGIWLMIHRVQGDRMYTKNFKNNLFSLTISFDDIEFIASDEAINLLYALTKASHLNENLTDLKQATDEYYLSHKDVDGCYADAKVVKLNNIVFSCDAYNKFNDYSHYIEISIFDDRQAQLSYEIKNMTK